MTYLSKNTKIANIFLAYFYRKHRIMHIEVYCKVVASSVDGTSALHFLCNNNNLYSLHDNVHKNIDKAHTIE